MAGNCRLIVSQARPPESGASTGSERILAPGLPTGASLRPMAGNHSFMSFNRRKMEADRKAKAAARRARRSRLPN